MNRIWRRMRNRPVLNQVYGQIYTQIRYQAGADRSRIFDEINAWEQTWGQIMAHVPVRVTDQVQSPMKLAVWNQIEEEL